jgi:glycosyltransferase involved in cell wall biosynthesis
MRVLIHCVYGQGGLAEHVHYQARAFARKGNEVFVLCPKDFLPGRNPDYDVSRTYRSLQSKSKPPGALRRPFAIARKAASFIGAQWRLAWEVLRRKPDFVLLDSYMEYLAPLWVWPHLLLAKARGITYVANLHDPVRDFVVGPAWWHRFSVWLAYQPISIVIVHQQLPDPAAIPRHVRVHIAPVGVYDLKDLQVDTGAVRELWKAPPNSVIFLAFGFIRNNKNVDLLIRALAQNPDAFLVVMGTAQSTKHRPMKFYRDLAHELGVENRVFFHEDFVPDEAMAGYFAAADFIAITYNKAFRSQSGVLNVAARAKRPVLASGGEGPLWSCVERFRLGEFVEPDNIEALTEGMRKLTAQSKGQSPKEHEPDWDGYTAYASWDSNVSIVLDAVDSVSAR